MDRYQLHADLVKNFTGAELSRFAGRLGVNYEQLGGKTPDDKAGSLIGKMERHGRLPELIYRLIQEQPHLQPAYDSYLRTEEGPRDAYLEWLDGVAAGQGPAIEEPPTMRWDSGKHSLEDEDDLKE